VSWRERCDRLNKSIVKIFGGATVYTPASTGIPETAIFHFEAVSTRIDVAGRHIDADAPTAYVRLADLSQEPAPGDTITAQGKQYSIVSGEPDGYGAMRLWLREVV
jgi:hypothetical protein